MFGIRPPALDEHELERLLINFETAVQVRRRHQLYLWTQGVLQSFLPHETLLCAMGSITYGVLRTEISSRALITHDEHQALVHGENSLLQDMARHWAQGGGLPLAVSASEGHAASERLQRAGISAALCHGMPQFAAGSPRQFNPGSFFVFLQVPPLAGGRYKYLLEILLPHLHAALMHVCGSEAVENSFERNVSPVLSDREQQVLQWIKQGKTNQEIGQILAISPLTVKNHVQKILRKLNVTNRAQAAARGLGEDAVKAVSRQRAGDETLSV